MSCCNEQYLEHKYVIPYINPQLNIDRKIITQLENRILYINYISDMFMKINNIYEFTKLYPFISSAIINKSYDVNSANYTNFKRTVTTLKRQDGTYATNSLISPQINIYRRLLNGQPFVDEEFLFGRLMFVKYMPLVVDKYGKTIVASFVGFPITNTV